jgi:hypothetical protein
MEHLDSQQTLQNKIATSNQPVTSNSSTGSAVDLKGENAGIPLSEVNGY